MSQSIPQQLVQIANSTTGFQRLHAAEALVNVDAPAEAAECLRAAPPTTQPLVGYAIVTRRIFVLANVDPKKNLAEIKQVALDSRSFDRLHSAEALAKLKAPADDTVARSLQDWRMVVTEDQRPFIDWVLIRWGRSDAHVLEGYLTCESAVARQRAAYVIRMLPPDVPIPADIVAALQKAFQSEKSSSVRTAMLASLYLLSAESDRASWEKAIDQRLPEATPAETTELITVLGLRKSATHKAFIEQATRNASVEIRIAALVALFRLNSEAKP